MCGGVRVVPRVCAVRSVWVGACCLLDSWDVVVCLWGMLTLVRFLLSAIYVELYYVFISLWGHHLYTPYPILFLVFIILIMVTICITVALTYLQLSMENHRWWWMSVFSGGCVRLSFVNVLIVVCVCRGVFLLCCVGVFLFVLLTHE